MSWRRVIVAYSCGSVLDNQGCCRDSQQHFLGPGSSALDEVSDVTEALIGGDGVKLTLHWHCGKVLGGREGGREVGKERGRKGGRKREGGREGGR